MPVLLERAILVAILENRRHRACGALYSEGYLRFPWLELGGATKQSPSQTGRMQSESLNTPNACGSRRVLLLSAGRAEGQET